MIYNGRVNFSINSIRIKLSDNEYEAILDSSQLGNIIIRTKTGRLRPVLVIIWDSKTSNKSIYSEIPEHEIPKTIQEFQNNLFTLDLHLGIWFDICTNTMYLVRDIFGISSIFYIYTQTEFFFSSHIRNLALNAKDRPAICEDAIVDYLNSYTPPFGYDLTYFQGIKRLFPGNYIKVNSQQLSLVSYTQFKPDQYTISHGTLKDYGYVFRDLLIDSLKRNTNDLSEIGLFLSGGLDSSSLSALTRFIYPDKKLNTYFFDSGIVSNSDRPYVQDVVHSINSVHKVVMPNFENLNLLEEQIISYGGPSISISGGLPNRLVRESAKLDRVSMLLSGHCGDNIIDHGYRYLNEIFEAEHWRELEAIEVNILNYMEKSYDQKTFIRLSKSRSFFNNVIYSHISKNKSIIILFRALYSLGRIDTVKFVLNKLVNDIISKLKRLYFRDDSLVRRDFLMRSSKFIYDGAKPSNCFSLYNAISTKEFIVTEELDNISSSHFTKIRFPFLDKNLYEFSLSVPNRLKYNMGLTRGTLREGLTGILPKSISERVTKHIFGESMKDFSLAYYRYYADYLSDNSIVWEVVDKKPFFHALSRINESSHSSKEGVAIYSINVFKTISLAIWLHHYTKSKP